MDGIGIEPICPVFQAGANPSQLPVRRFELPLLQGEDSNFRNTIQSRVRCQLPDPAAE